MQISNNIFRSLPKQYVIIDANLAMTDATDGFLNHNHIKRQELNELNLSDVFKKNSVRLKHTINEVFKTGKSSGTTYPLLNKDGTFQYIIHETKHEELMDPKEATDVLDRITDGFFTLSHNWLFTSVNPITKQLLKKRNDQIIGKAFYEIFPLKESEVFMSHFFEAARRKKPVFFETTYENQIYSVQTYPQRDGGVATFYRNITELKKAHDKLEEALASKNEFITVASHELKTPLTALKLQVEMAKRKIDSEGLQSLSPTKVKSIIDRTHQDVLRLSRLVDDMLDVSRINTGKFKMEYNYFNLEDFMEEFLSRATTGLTNIDNLLISKINAPVLVHWDRFRIEQVILNILANAVRYGNNSSIELTVTTGGGFAYIKIKDFGPGISKQNQKIIFERYQRGNCNRETDGFGLGLYLCHEIIKHHQGNISLESKLGAGSTFEIQLPLTVSIT